MDTRPFFLSSTHETAFPPHQGIADVRGQLHPRAGISSLACPSIRATLYLAQNLKSGSAERPMPNPRQSVPALSVAFDRET